MFIKDRDKQKKGFFMRKKIAMLLMIFVISGCGKSQSQSIAEEMLVKLITHTTYTQEELNQDNIPQTIASCFSEDGYVQFISSQTAYIYSAFFKEFKVEDTRDIKLKKIKVKQHDKSQLTYQIQYQVRYGQKWIKMKDMITLKIDRENQVTDFLILNNSDIIRKMFLDVRIM